MPLTVTRLAQLLSESFELDGWGDIDPHLFSEVARPWVNSDHAEEAQALREVLQRVVNTLNEEK